MMNGLFVYFHMRVYFGGWQIGWSWSFEWMDLFDKPKEMFLFISKQKRNFDFGFLKNTFFLKLKSDSWPCWHLATLPLSLNLSLKLLPESSWLEGPKRSIIIFNLYSGMVPSEFSIVRLSLIEKVKFWLRSFLTLIIYWPRKYYFPFRTIGFYSQGWPG